jgi:ATP-dependent DNA helicase RecG
VAEGEAQLVIGTHALIQEAVEFAGLGLAIVDEQHRFGVAQRLRLRAGLGSTADGRDRCAAPADAVSATPIPRTLAMSYLRRPRRQRDRRTAAWPRAGGDQAGVGRRRDEVLERVRAEARSGAQATGSARWSRRAI